MLCCIGGTSREQVLWLTQLLTKLRLFIVGFEVNVYTLLLKMLVFFFFINKVIGRYKGMELVYWQICASVTFHRLNTVKVTRRKSSG